MSTILHQLWYAILHKRSGRSLDIMILKSILIAVVELWVYDQPANCPLSDDELKKLWEFLTCNK